MLFIEDPPVFFYCVPFCRKFEMQPNFSDEYIGDPLERLGAEAERRLDIAQQNFNNAVTTFKTRHDQINRLPIKQILKYAPPTFSFIV